ncbi:MAG: thioesterase family protein [Peptococcaceae bacterium]|nr:thioesterase family protein [Peptococcaceae bacterium]
MNNQGLKGKSESIVTEEKTAKFVGSGELEVLATPMLAALMENAAVRALNLPEDQTSVGTYLNLKHLAPTPVGMEGWAEAEVIKTEGRKIIFKVVAFDEKEKIGEGEHERVVVSKDKFITKAKNKKSG